MIPKMLICRPKHNSNLLFFFFNVYPVNLVEMITQHHMLPVVVGSEMKIFCLQTSYDILLILLKENDHWRLKMK